MKTLYIDFGSTNIKYECNGEANSIPFPSPVINNNYYFEVELSKIVKIVDDLFASFMPNRTIFSVQMHGYVLSDKNHEPLTNYISWRDKRFLNYSGKIDFDIPKTSGVMYKNNLPVLSILTSFSQNNYLKNNAVYFDTLGSFFIYHYTKIHISHSTDACPSGFYLANDCCINSCITQKEPFNNLVFPKITNEVIAVGKHSGIEFFTAVGDQQASVLGADINNEYIFNTGTASQLCSIEKTFITGEFESRPFFNGKTLCTVTNLTGGANFNSAEPNAFEKIKDELSIAISKLPKHTSVAMLGGLAQYNCLFFYKVFYELNLKSRFIEKSSAINGLKTLLRS